MPFFTPPPLLAKFLPYVDISTYVFARFALDIYLTWKPNGLFRC